MSKNLTFRLNVDLISNSVYHIVLYGYSAIYQG